MEREVSSVVSLTVMLVSVALVLSIAWFTVSMGNGIKTDSYMAMSKLSAQVESSQLISINDKDPIVVPKAAAYSLISAEYRSIDSVTYTDEDGRSSVVTYKDDAWESTGEIEKRYISPQDILEESLSGKVQLSATKAPSGNYAITVISVE